MRLKTRLEKIEKQCKVGHRCLLLVAIADGTEGPTREQSQRYRDQQKASGECEKCTGVCVLNWTEQPPRIWRQSSQGER